MYRWPGTGSGPGLLSRSIGKRGLPSGSKRTSLVLTHPTPLFTPLFLCRGTSSSPPSLLCFLPPRERCVRPPASTTVSLALSISLFPLLVVDGLPSRSSCLSLCTHRICNFLVSLRLRGGPRRCPIPSTTKACGSSGCSLPSWPVSLAAYGLPSPPTAGFSVGVGPLISLCLHSPPLPPMPSVPSRAPRHLVPPLLLGPCTLVSPSRHPGPNGCHFWASIVSCTVYFPESKGSISR